MSNKDITRLTIELIDSLKSTTAAFGLAGTGDDYNVVIEIFLYKFFNDKFGYEAKRNKLYGERLCNGENSWDKEYDKFTEEEVEDLFSYLPASVPRLKPEHTLSHIYNSANKADFADILDATLLDIASLNSDIFAITLEENKKLNIFNEVTKSNKINNRDEFAKSLVRNIASCNFEEIFSEKYDFFSGVFEYLLKGFNNAGGGKYAEYYTPRAIAQVMARLLVGDNTDLRGMTCYDPSAGTGTLLMALAHQIGEDRCSIYSQDISAKSSELLRLNLILNNLSSSLPNVIQGNTLLKPAHKESNGSIKKFDFIVSNPPFKLDFPDYRDTLATDNMRFWAGVPNAVKKADPNKPKMAIYTCFIQHVLNSLKDTGKGAIVVPTGFITAKSGIEKKILERIVNEKWVYGCVSMPSNVFATTGTNVSVLFFDKSGNNDKVILIDASKLGEEYKEGNNQKRRLRDFEIDKIVNTFQNKESIDDFSVAVGYDEIKEKGCSLSAGQYFDIKIDYVDITEEEFNQRMTDYKTTLKQQFEESHRIEAEIMQQLESLKFNNINKG